jgi:hypothetical protein
MTRRLPVQLLLATLVATGWLGLAIPLQAQTAARQAVITAIDMSGFPEIGAYLAVDEADGRRLSGLPADAFSLREDGAPVTGLKVSEVEVGVQVVFALDISSPFKARDIQGITRLDYVQQALKDFAQSRPWMKDKVDDVSFVATEGDFLLHSEYGAKLAEAVQNYTTEYAAAADSVSFINNALNLAAEAPRRPGMQRTLVFISGGLARQGADTPVDDIIARAQAARVHIDTVLAGSAAVAETAGGLNLKRLAEMTGGSFSLLESAETFTPVFETLASQRQLYRLAYHSGLSATGQHMLAATVRLPDGSTLTSPEAEFPLRVEPPVILMPEMPRIIQRIAPSGDADPEHFQPAEYALTVRLEFPDGYERAINAGELVVDGEVVDTQAMSGTTTFTWPLLSYSTPMTHTVQVRLTDTLGLAAYSPLANVFIAVAKAGDVPAAATPGAAAEPAKSLLLPLLLGAGMLVAGLGIGLWLWLTRFRRDRVPALEAAAAEPQDEVQQPALPGLEAMIPPPPHPPEPPKPAPRPHVPLFSGAGLHLPARRPVPRPQPKGKAFLEVLESGGGGEEREEIEILTARVRLGRDPEAADVIFPDRSVSRLHARIEEATSPEGGFRIYDEKSTSGTWLNFEPIPPEGETLNHGDVINLGRVQVRFNLRGAATPGAPPHRRGEPPPEHDLGDTEPYRPMKRK